MMGLSLNCLSLWINSIKYTVNTKADKLANNL